ncbi:RidA family protein, partial [Bacteroidota bacterium]
FNRSSINNNPTMKRIFTADAPQPGGHYSQAIVHGDTVYLAGQLPVDPETGEIAAGSIFDQTRLVLNNLRAVLEAAGSSVDHVVKVTVFVPDISLWGSVNDVYADFFGDHRPARVVVPTRDLHHGCLVEIDAVAAVRDS